MEDMNTTKTATRTHALIRFEAHFTNAMVLSTGPEALMLDAHEACVSNPTDDAAHFFYSVRPVDHDMTADAAAQMAARLSERQAAALIALASIAPSGWVQPGSRKVGRQVALPGFSDSTDLIAPARRLEAHGYVSIRGLAYAPKSYRLTPTGRMVAAALNA